MKPDLQPSDAHPQQPVGDSDGPDLLTQLQVCARLGISDQTWMRWRKAGRTPDAVPMPSGRLKWRRADIETLAGAPPAPRVTRRYFGKVRSGQLVAVR